MSSPRLVRGTKGRLFACLGVLTLFAGVLFLYHSTRVELDEVRNAASKCRQEQDSLAAQVQVMSETKVRLEKSLQQEKVDHRQAKEELQTRMNDEQQIRDRENLENVNKYKALQQQYKLLQNEHEDLSEHFNKLKSEMSSCSEALIHLLKNIDKYRGVDQEYKLLQNEHEDLNEYINKLKSEKSSCTDAISRLEALFAILQQQQATKDTEMDTLRVQNIKLEDDNKMLSHKLASLQIAISQENRMSFMGKENSLVSPNISQQKGSSTKGTNKDGIEHEGESAGGNQAGYLEPPQKVNPAAQSSSTAAQEHNLLPARPAQPAPLQSAASNLKNGDSLHNGLSGVLPAPLGFGHPIHGHQQEVLQAPYRQQRMSNHGFAQSHNQVHLIPPGDTGVQNEVLPMPPMPHHDYVHMPNFNNVLPQNMNPFQGSRVNIQGHDSQIRSNIKSKKSGLYNIVSGNLYHTNNLDHGKPHGLANPMYDVHDINKMESHIDALKKSGVPDLPGIGFMVQGSQLGRSFAHDGLLRKNLAPPINKETLQALHQPGAVVKNLKFAPLDGDVNQHGELVRAGADDFDLGPHQMHHGVKIANPHEKQEIPHAPPFHYQAGDYDKEEQDHPAHGDDDDDVDPAEYNNDIANQAHPPKKLVHRRFAVPQHHPDGVMVNPR